MAPAKLVSQSWNTREVDAHLDLPLLQAWRIGINSEDELIIDNFATVVLGVDYFLRSSSAINASNTRSTYLDTHPRP